MSVVNSPVYLSKVVNLGAAFTITSPNLIVTNPDGTAASTVTATVSPSGATSTNPHTMSALFVPSMGGLHIARFQGVVSTQTMNFPFHFWAAWTDVYTEVRNLLGVSATSMPDSRLDTEFSAIVTELRNFSGLMDYYLFTTTPTNYQTGFDQGMVYLLASRVRPYIGGKRPTGEVALMKKGNTTVQYSIGSPKMTATLEDQWWSRGMGILQANLPEIETAMESDRYGDEIMDRGELATGNKFPTGNWSVSPGGRSTSSLDSLDSLLFGQGEEF